MSNTIGSHTIHGINSKLWATSFGLLLFCLIALTGCSYVWTREFVQPKHAPLYAVEGWSMRPDIYAYRQKGGHPTPEVNSFVFDIGIGFKRQQKHTDLGELPLLEIDSVTVVEKGTGRQQKCSLSSAFWVSSTGYDSLNRTLTFQSNEPGKFLNIAIPSTVDTFDITFVAKVTTGKHVIIEKYTVPHDSIAPGPAETARYYPVTITMIRHETKSLTPSFLIEDH